MAPKTQHVLCSVGSILILWFSSFVLSAHTAEAASIIPAARDLPALGDFALQVRNGQAGELRGAYAPGLFAYIIVPQPQGDPTFVSPRKSFLTQFSSASDLGSIGLLAHSYLAGTEFGQIQNGQVIYLIFGDGALRRYAVTTLARFQALQPESPVSSFVDLQDGSRLSSQMLLSKIYSRPGALVLQTCIEADGIDTWGRLFVIAESAVLQKTADLPLSGR